MSQKIELNKIHLSVVKLSDEEAVEINKRYEKGGIMLIFNFYKPPFHRKIEMYIAKEDKLEDSLPEILKKIEEFLNKQNDF